MAAADGWRRSLLNWISCILETNISDIDDLVDCKVFFEIIKYLDEIKDENILCYKTAVTLFLRREYPYFRRNPNVDIINTSDDAVLIASLLLHYSCMKSKDGSVRGAMCQNLDLADQKAIMLFANNLMKHENITERNLLNAISASSSDAGLDSSLLSMSTPIRTSKGSVVSPAVSSFNSSFPMVTPTSHRSRKVFQLEAELGAERFDRNFLQEELNRQYCRIDELEKMQKSYITEIQRLRGELISSGDSNNCEDESDKCSRCNHKEKVLQEQLRSHELEILQLVSNAVNIEEERDLLKTKLEEIEKGYSEWRSQAVEAEKEREVLKYQLDKANIELNNLKIALNDTTQCLNEYRRENQMNVSIECDEDIFSLRKTLNNSLNSTPENLGKAVIDIQLKEQINKNCLLVEQIEKLKKEKDIINMDLKLRTGKLTQLENQNSELSNQTAILNCKVSELIEINKIKSLDFKKELDEHKVLIEELISTKNNIQQSIDKSVKSIQDCQKNLMLDSQANNLQEDTVFKIDFGSYILKLTEEVNGLLCDKIRILNELHTAKAKLTESEENMAFKNEELAAESLKNKQLCDQLVKQVTDLDAKNTIINNVQQQSMKNEVLLDERNTELKNKCDELNSLREETALLEKTISHYYEKFLHYENLLLVKENEKDVLNVENTDLKGKLKNIDNEARNLKDELFELNRKFSSISFEYEKNMEILQATEEAMKDLEFENANNLNKINSLTTRCDELEINLSLKIKDIEELQKNVDNSEIIIKSKDDHILNVDKLILSKVDEIKALSERNVSLQNILDANNNEMLNIQNLLESRQFEQDEETTLGKITELCKIIDEQSEDISVRDELLNTLTNENNKIHTLLKEQTVSLINDIEFLEGKIALLNSTIVEQNEKLVDWENNLIDSHKQRDDIEIERNNLQSMYDNNKIELHNIKAEFIESSNRLSSVSIENDTIKKLITVKDAAIKEYKELKINLKLKLKNKADNFENLLAAKNEELNRVVEELHNSKEETSLLSDKIYALWNAFHVDDEEKFSTQDILESVNEKLKWFASVVAANDAELVKLSSIHKNLDNKLEERRKDLVFKNELIEKLIIGKEKIESLAEEYSVKLKNVEKMMHDKEEKCTHYENIIAINQQEKTNLEQERNDIRNNFDNLKKELKTVTDELFEANTKLSSLSVENENIKMHLSEKEETIKDLECVSINNINEINLLGSKCKDLELNLNSKMADIEAKEILLRSNDIAMSDINKKLSIKDEEIKSLVENITNLQSITENYSDQLEKKSNDIINLNDLIKILEVEKNAFQNNLRATEDQMDNLKQEFSTREKELESNLCKFSERLDAVLKEKEEINDVMELNRIKLTDCEKIISDQNCKLDKLKEKCKDITIKDELIKELGIEKDKMESIYREQALLRSSIVQESIVKQNENIARHDEILLAHQIEKDSADREINSLRNKLNCTENQIETLKQEFSSKERDHESEICKLKEQANVLSIEKHEMKDLLNSTNAELKQCTESIAIKNSELEKMISENALFFNDARKKENATDLEKSDERKLDKNNENVAYYDDFRLINQNKKDNIIQNVTIDAEVQSASLKQELKEQNDESELYKLSENINALVNEKQRIKQLLDSRDANLEAKIVELKQSKLLYSDLFNKLEEKAEDAKVKIELIEKLSNEINESQSKFDFESKRKSEEIASLKEENANLEKTRQEDANNINRLNEELEVKIVELEQSKLLYSDIFNKLEEKAEDVKVKIELIEKLSNEINESQSKFDFESKCKSEEIASLKEENAHLEKTQKEDANNINRLNEELEVKIVELEQSKLLYSDLFNKLEEKAEDVKVKIELIERLSNEINESQSKFDFESKCKSEEIASLKEENAHLEKTQKEDANNINRLNEELEVKIVELEQSKLLYSDLFNKLEEKAEDVKVKIELIEKLSNEINESQSKFDFESKCKSEEIASLKEENLEKTRKEDANNINRLNEELVELKNKMISASLENEDVKRNLRETDAQLSLYKSENQLKCETIKSLESEISTLKQVISNHENLLTLKNNTIIEINEKLRTKDAEIKSFSEKIANALKIDNSVLQQRVEQNNSLQQNTFLLNLIVDNLTIVLEQNTNELNECKLFKDKYEALHGSVEAMSKTNDDLRKKIINNEEQIGDLMTAEKILRQELNLNEQKLSDIAEKNSAFGRFKFTESISSETRALVIPEKTWDELKQVIRIIVQQLDRVDGQNCVQNGADIEELQSAFDNCDNNIVDGAHEIKCIYDSVAFIENGIKFIIDKNKSLRNTDRNNQDKLDTIIKATPPEIISQINQQRMKLLQISDARKKTMDLHTLIKIINNKLYEFVDCPNEFNNLVVFKNELEKIFIKVEREYFDTLNKFSDYFNIIASWRTEIDNKSNVEELNSEVLIGILHEIDSSLNCINDNITISECIFKKILKANPSLKLDYESPCARLALDNFNEIINKLHLSKEEINSLRKKSEDDRKILDQLKLDNDSLSSRNEELTNKIFALRKVLQEVESKNLDLIRLRENMEVQRESEFKQHVDKMIDENAKLQEQIESLSEKLNDANMRIYTENVKPLVEFDKLLNDKLDLVNELVRKESEIANLNKAADEYRVLKDAYETLVLEHQKIQMQIANKHDTNKIVGDVRIEYEDKLTRMKQKMKQLYQEQIAVNAEKQKEETAGLEALCKKYAEKIKSYEAHVNQLSSELWKVGEKLLMEKNEKDWLKQQLRERNGSHQSLNSISSTISLPQTKMENTLTKKRQILPNDKIRPSIDAKKSLFKVPDTSKVESGGLHMSDEEGELFDNTYLAELKTGISKSRTKNTFNSSVTSQPNRLSELQYRNSLCLPHLKSSYPAETQFQKFKEDDIKMGAVNLDDSMTLKMNRPKKEVGQTSYKKPGPPTPSKKGGRLSLQGNEARDPLKEQNENVLKKVSTPSKIRGFFGGNSSRSSSRDENTFGTPKGRRLSIFRKQK